MFSLRPYLSHFDFIDDSNYTDVVLVKSQLNKQAFEVGIWVFSSLLKLSSFHNRIENYIIHLCHTYFFKTYLHIHEEACCISIKGMSITLYDFFSNGNSNRLLQTFTSLLLPHITFQRCKNNAIEAECASFGIIVISGGSHCLQHLLSSAKWATQRRKERDPGRKRL